MSPAGLAQPKYMELSRELKARIRSGEFRPGQQIPTEQELMDRYRVSRNTVRHAVTLLEEENYLTRRRGAGTFVAPRDSEGRPQRSLESILFLLVDDVLQGEAYNIAQAAAAQRWAAQRRIALVTSSLVTEELIQGYRPAILDRGFYQAVLLDGWVTDMHCQIARELKLPYLIVGNHPVSPNLPQVRIDIEGAFQKIFEHLTQRYPQQPVALLLEPLNLHVSKEMLLAYMRRIEQSDHQGPLLELVADYQIAAGLERVLRRAGGPFSLILNIRHLEGTVDFYRRRGIDPRHYPIACIANKEDVKAEDHPFVSLIPVGPRSIIGETLSRFAEAYERGVSESLHVLLEAPDVLVLRE